MEKLSKISMYELWKQYKYIVIFPLISLLIFYILFWSIIEALKVAVPLWAIIWAVYHQEIKQYFNRPVLEIREFNQERPYLRREPIINTDSIGFFVNIPLKNVGRKTAKNCQPMVSAMAKFHNNTWHREQNWIPVTLLWAAGEDSEHTETGRKIREERNLVPFRPYFFNLGYVKTNDSDDFYLLQVVILTGQDYSFGPGKYCFEVSVTAEEIDKPTVKYFIVDWQGKCVDDLNVVKSHLKVIEQLKAPWQTES